MNYLRTDLAPGLYFVGTPIGTARDITLRALDILASVDVLVAEDTRSLRRLMDIHAIALDNRPLLSYHDHSGKGALAKLLQALAAGKSVAYASEAGMPLIADPGYRLGRAAAEAGHLVTSAPGPSALTTALALSGLPTDAVFFGGFLPNSAGARRKRLAELAEIPATLVFYESPKRTAAALADMANTLGGEREAAIARELTKAFEEIRRGPLNQIAKDAKEIPPKGEVVLVIGRGGSAKISEIDLDLILADALKSNSVRDAADIVARIYNLPRRRVYQAALRIGKE